MSEKSQLHAKLESKHYDVVVLFPDDWAPYSPTLLRLTKQLRESYTVRVHAIDTGRSDITSLCADVYRFTSIPSWLARFLRRVRLYRPTRILALARGASRDLARAKHIIAVDADGAFTARLLARKFHYLSLEIGVHPMLQAVVRTHAISITTQSRERLNFQFSSKTIGNKPIFFVQNAPEIPPPASYHKLSQPRKTHPHFIYFGNTIPLHGLYSMIELIKTWPEATLTLQGIISHEISRIIHERYGNLLAQGRLIIGTEYIRESEVGKFLCRFDIGLCLYELDAKHRHNFNYISVPAGKMFNYFAAGLPVIASDLVGLNPVSQCGAGVQVLSNSATELRAAALKILSDYDRYRASCHAAAAHFDFRSGAQKLISFIRSTETM